MLYRFSIGHGKVTYRNHKFIDMKKNDLQKIKLGECLIIILQQLEQLVPLKLRPVNITFHHKSAVQAISFDQPPQFTVNVTVYIVS